MNRLPNSLPYVVVPNGGRLAWRLLDMTSNDWLVLVPSVAVVFVSSQLLGLRVAFVAVLALVMLMFRFPYGRGYDVLIEYLKTLYIRHVLRGVIWDPDPTLSWFGRKLRQRRPFDLSVQRIDAGKRRVAVLHDVRKKVDHLVIVGRGSNASALDMDGYDAQNMRIAEVIKHAKAETQLQIGASYGRLLRPYDEWGLATSLNKIMNPDVAVPEGTVTDWSELTRRQRVDMRLHKNMNQLKSLVPGKGAEPMYFVVVSVTRPSAWRKLKKRGLSERELYNAPLVRIATTMVEDLETIGVENVRCLSLTALARMRRLSMDIAQLDGYRRAIALGKVPLDDDQLEVSDSGEVLTDMHEYPDGKITVGRTWVDIGGTKHRTLRVVETPRQMLPSDIHSLYSVTSHWSSVAFSGETISGKAESRRFTWGITLLRGIDRARGRRIYETHDEKQKKRDLERRHTDIQRSGSVGQHGNIFITVSGLTEEDLDDAQHAFLKSARGKNKILKVVKGESRQLRAMQTGTLAANQM